MARKERYLVGLDVGTSKVTAVVGEVLDDGGLDIVGIGVAESRGHPARRRGQPRGGGRLDQEGDRGGRADGRRRDRLGPSRACRGPHIKGFNSRGVIAVAGKNREITREDVRRAIDAAKAVSLPTGREILHVLPQDFVVDEQDGIGAPVGMTGARLEVNVHIITGSQSSTQNIVACVNRAGVERRRDRGRAARGERVGADRGREGARRRAGRHRRRHDRHRDLRARQPLAHRGGRHRRRSFHERHRRRPAHAGAGCGEDQAQVRVRAVRHGRRRRDDGGGERRRAQAARDGAADPVRDPAAARRGDLSSGVGRDSARRIREEPATRASC